MKQGLKNRIALSLFVAWALSVGACAEAAVKIANAWSPPTPPVTSVGAVYMELTADTADRLLSASTPIAEQAQLHQTVEEKGMSTMRALPDLRLEKGRKVQLAPQGTHFMLFGLRSPLKVGDHFSLKLRFEKAGEQTVQVTVQSSTERAPSHHH